MRREVNAETDEIVRVYDFFKPGIPEIAAAPERHVAALGQTVCERRQKTFRISAQAWFAHSDGILRIAVSGQSQLVAQALVPGTPQSRR